MFCQLLKKHKFAHFFKLCLFQTNSKFMSWPLVVALASISLLIQSHLFLFVFQFCHVPYSVQYRIK